MLLIKRFKASLIYFENNQINYRSLEISDNIVAVLYVLTHKIFRRSVF